jgi:hypothetical protein
MLKQKHVARRPTQIREDSSAGFECRISRDGRLVVSREGELLRVSKVYVIASQDGSSERDADVSLVVRPEQEASRLQSLLDTLFIQLSDPDRKGAGKKNVAIAADEELTLRCGKSSITLTKSGKVIVRGTKIVSRATGEHKIRGAQISLN